MTSNPKPVVLLVEDDDDLRNAVADVLHEEGYELAHARHGEEALAMLRRRRGFCVILLDMRMPVMGGMEFLRAQMRDSKISSIPVVAFSADARDREEALALGISGSLSKPVDILQLLEAVASLCGDPDRLELPPEPRAQAC